MGEQNLGEKVVVPWLMLSNDDEDSTCREFYSLSEDRILKITLPESNGKRCFSSQGWLFTIGKDEEVNLLHPLTRSQIRLPNLKTFADLEHLKVREMQKHFISKVVLSASPSPPASSSTSSSSSDYVVMVIHGSVSKLAFFRPGDGNGNGNGNGDDACWTTIDTTPFRGFFDIIYHRNQFYAVDGEGRVVVCDLNGGGGGGTGCTPPIPTTAAKAVVSVLPFSPSLNIFSIEKLYLVESLSGKLLMVSREGVQFRDDLTYGTTGFRVFEMNESDGNWNEVKSIDDEALFLGDNSSLPVRVSSCSNYCKPNHIYFTEDFPESYNAMPNGGGKDMGVYNLLDGTFEPHFKGQSYSLLTPPLWVAQT